MLEALVGLTLMSSSEARPLFTNPLAEPFFYQRYFKRWVAEGLEELRRMTEKDNELIEKVQGTG